MELQSKKELFFNYLQRFSQNPGVFAKFEKYYEILKEENAKINLFSRKMEIEDIWTVHFMDSLTLCETDNDLNHKRILDFGTGGGLPGIPLKILFPESEVYFLDSIAKKMSSVKNFCKLLDLKTCNFVCSRIEDLPSSMRGTFDRIVCRSVKILPLFIKPMMMSLKPEGKIYLYKAKQIEDALLFKHYKIYDVSNPILGERKIVEIEYGKNNNSR